MSSALNFFKGLSTLQLALGVSFAVHAALLTVRFVDPEGFNRVFQDTPLEVLLVNAKSEELPEKAMAIAQASLAGGGDAEKGRATSPLPPNLTAKVGDTPEEDERMIEALKERQNQVLAQVRKQLANMPPPDLQAVNPSQEAIEREEKRRATVKMLAEMANSLTDNCKHWDVATIADYAQEMRLEIEAIAKRCAGQ
jgi:protein TonB